MGTSRQPARPTWLEVIACASSGKTQEGMGSIHTFRRDVNNYLLADLLKLHCLIWKEVGSTVYATRRSVRWHLQLQMSGWLEEALHDASHKVCRSRDAHLHHVQAIHR